MSTPGLAKMTKAIFHVSLTLPVLISQLMEGTSSAEVTTNESFMLNMDNESTTESSTGSFMYKSSAKVEIVAGQNRRYETTDPTEVEPCTYKEATDRTEVAETSTLYTHTNTSEVTAISKEFTETSSIIFTWVGYVTVPVLLTTGIVGNTLIIFVMQKPNFHKKSYSILTTALAFSDLTMTIMFPFNKQFVIQLFQWDIRSQGWFGCRLFFWLWRTAKISASWLLVLLSIERFVAVWFPLHVKQLCTTKNGYIGSFLVVLCIGTLTFVWVSISDHLHDGVCLSNFAITEDKIYIIKALVISGASIYCLIPGFFILIFNIFIVGKLYKKAISQKLLNSTKTIKVGNKAWTMLVSISVAFVVLVIPTGVLHCYTVFSGVKMYESKQPSFVIIRDITQVFEQFNHVINFFLYLLCNKQFCTDVKEIMIGKKILTRTNSMTAMTTLSQTS